MGRFAMLSRHENAIKTEQGCVMTRQRLSSRQTFFIQRLFPVIWFGILAVIAAVALVAMVVTHAYKPLVFILIGTAIMGIIGHFVMRKLVFDLRDEVWDAGSELLVRNRDEDAHIPLANIVNISCAGYTHPPRITLMPQQAGCFGKDMIFCPKGISFSLFSRNRVARELVESVDYCVPAEEIVRRTCKQVA